VPLKLERDVLFKTVANATKMTGGADTAACLESDNDVSGSVDVVDGIQKNSRFSGAGMRTPQLFEGYQPDQCILIVPLLSHF